MDAKDIAQLAHLARINVNDSTLEETAKNIDNILDLVNELQAVDTEGIEPMAHPMDATQRLRADDVTEANQRDALQTTAPNCENGLYLVPKVID